LSSTARLAIENDPNLIRNHGGTSLINKNGESELKSFKFGFDAASALGQLNEEGSSVLEKTKIKNEEFKLPSLDSLVLEEDSKVPISKVPCSGCGSHLQFKNRHLAGFMSADKFKLMSKKELRFATCYRCETLKRKKIMLNLETKPFDYDNFVLNKILAQRKAHVILLVDLLDIPNSIYDNWSKLISNNNSSLGSNQIDISIIGNKVDLLPNTGPIFYKSIVECLKANCEKKGIMGDQIKYIELISAKTGYNIENVSIWPFYK